MCQKLLRSLQCGSSGASYKRLRLERWQRWQRWQREEDNESGTIKLGDLTVLSFNLYCRSPLAKEQEGVAYFRGNHSRVDFHLVKTNKTIH